MHDTMRLIAQYAAYLAETAAALTIVLAALQSFCLYLRQGLRSKGPFKEIIQSRVKLGHALSLALEFLIGADILKTAVAPSWNEIGQLAAIVAIRTVLNYFLMYELKAGPQEKDA